MKQFIIRDLRKKDQYKIDDAYLNGYARLCGVYATAVYNSLSRHADFHTQECFPSIEKMAEQHGISKPSVIKGIRELIKWNIISVHKERDSTTQRQLPNIYTLVDKSIWKPKTGSRVSVVDPGIGQKPSKRGDESRVSVAYHKDTHIKDNTIDTIAESNSADEIKQVIDSFKEVNPSYQKWFPNKTQRDACKRLVKIHGLPKVLQVVGFLQKSNTVQYAPVVTTPIQLEDKWAALSAFFLKKTAEVGKNKIVKV